MSQFKPGDRVEVIAGPRAGEVTTVTSELEPYEGNGLLYTYGVTNSTPVHLIDLPPIKGRPGWLSCAPPHWLRPYPLDESTGPLTAEQLRKLCGVKEREDA